MRQEAVHSCAGGYKLLHTKRSGCIFYLVRQLKRAIHLEIQLTR
jgi:hypothetical protein